MDTAEKITLLCFLLQGVCCREFSISLPEKIRALSGSCVEIKCRFEIREEYEKDLTDNATGVWNRYGWDHKPVFSSSTSVQKSGYKGNITGKLKDKDCTTVFYDIRSNHSGQYYFSIEGKGGLQWMYHKNVSIDVIESPERPRVSAQQQELQDQQQVLEWSSVSLRCSAETLCSSPPPTLTWSSTPRIPLRESRPQELISDLNFTAAHTHHTLTFTCTVTYRIQESSRTANTSITLHVLYSPKNTSVSASPSGSVVEGSSVTLTCSSDANPAVLSYSWSRVSEGQVKTLQTEETGETLTFSRTDRTQRGFYYCTAQNEHGSQNASVELDIQYSPKYTTVSVSPSGSVLEGSSVTLTCSSDANPAVLSYSWSRVSEGQVKTLQTEETGETLTFSRTDRTQRGFYYCTAQNEHGSQNSAVPLDIQYVPEVSESSSCTGTSVTVCVCEADGNPSPTVQWHLSGRPVSNSSIMWISEERLNSTVLRSFIILHQSLTHTSTLECVANNTHGSQRKLIQLNASVVFGDCQQSTFSLVIILALILVLYALTVAFGLYKIRKLSAKLKTADTYMSLQLSAPPSEYETLNVK